jgi:hypothetical protein
MVDVAKNLIKGNTRQFANVSPEKKFNFIEHERNLTKHIDIPSVIGRLNGPNGLIPKSTVIQETKPILPKPVAHTSITGETKPFPLKRYPHVPSITTKPAPPPKYIPDIHERMKQRMAMFKKSVDR